MRGEKVLFTPSSGSWTMYNAVMHENDKSQDHSLNPINVFFFSKNLYELQEPFSQVCLLCLFALLYLICHPSSGDEKSHFTCFINFIANNIFHYGLLLERILQSAHDSSRPKLLIK